MMAAKANTSTSAVRTAQVAMTLSIFWVLWRVADGQQAIDILGTAQPAWLIAAALALTAQTVLSALRWRITARQLGLHLPTRLAIQEYYLSQIVNQALPGGVVGDAARAVRSREQQGLMAASKAVVFERFSGQVVMFVIMTGAFLVTYLTPGGLDWPAWSIPPVLLIIGAGFLVALVFLGATYLPAPLRQKVSDFTVSMSHALVGRNVVVAQITLSIATALLNLAAFALCARAVGVTLPPVMVLALVPVILFTMLIPLTISGWGLREGAAAAFLPLAGTTASEGLAASVAFGLTMLAATLPGLAAVWLHRKPQDIGT